MVYKGHHGTLGYPVAVKILHPGMSGEQEFIARFEREARAAAALNHTNIVNVIDFGSENDVFFIVMQYVDGADLSKIFDEVVVQRDGARFPLEITLSLVEEVAYGLTAAHKQGIIHRDIKPSNVMLSSTGHVKVADFGLARDIGDVGPSADLELTMPGRVVGTPSYMSPEQAAGGKVDARTDIFSLGVMAFQLIVGHKPFAGDSALDVQEQIISAELPRLDADTCPRYTPEIGHLLTKMLAKDPAHRFQTMQQTLRALTAAAESIDPNGNMLKYKREYMTRFAEAPVAFADELHAMAISGYLKRGFYFKNLGLSSIGDAVREFHHVLSLDTDHAKARSELQELRKKAEESGISLAVGQARADDSAAAPTAGTLDISDATMVAAPNEDRPDSRATNEPATEQDPVAEQPQEPETRTPDPEPTIAIPDTDASDPAGPSPRRPAGANRIRIAVGAAVILAAAAAALLWPRGDSVETRVADRGLDDGRANAVAHEVEQPPLATDEDAGNKEESAAAAAALDAQAAMIATKGDLSLKAFEGFPVAAGSFDRGEQAAARASEALAGAKYPAATSIFEEASRYYDDAARALDSEKEQRHRAAVADQELAALKAAAVSVRRKMEAARDAANRSGGVATDSNDYSQASGIARQATEKFATGDADGYRQASLLFAEATSGFQGVAATAATGARAMQKSRAEASRKTMTGTKDDLAIYGADLEEGSARYGEAEAAADEGYDAFARGDNETAQRKFEAAAGLYRESGTEIRRALADEERRAATAEIAGIVEVFFASVATADYDRFRSVLGWGSEMDDSWRKMIKKADSLSDRKSEIQLDEDGKSATVILGAALYTRSGGRVNTKPYPLAFTWRLESIDREWKIIDVQLN